MPATQTTAALPTVTQVRTYRAAMSVCDRVCSQVASEKSIAKLKKLGSDLAKRGLSIADMDRFDLDWSGNTQIVVVL